MPIILALRVDKTRKIRRGQDALWQVVRDLTAADRDRQVFLSEIARQMDEDASILKLHIGRLVKAGFMIPDTSIAGPCWRLVKRPTKIPVAQTRQDAMWASMRALKTFDARELALAATTEALPVSVSTAKQYLKFLAPAGYLALVREAIPGSGGRLALYRLKPSMDTGPEAPKVLRTLLVYDPNRDEVFGPAEAECQP